MKLLPHPRLSTLILAGALLGVAVGPFFGKRSAFPRGII